jgi:post-segregation antitoxin (ccd killing protein)
MTAASNSGRAAGDFLIQFRHACREVASLIHQGELRTAQVLVEALQDVAIPEDCRERAAEDWQRLQQTVAASRRHVTSRGSALRDEPAPRGRPIYREAAGQVGFIVGTGRCGTSIAASLMNAHSKICVPPELSFITRCYGTDLLFEKCLSGEMSRFTSEDFIGLIESMCPFRLEGFINLHRHFQELDYPQLDLRRVIQDLFDDFCFTNGKSVFLEQTPWYGLELHSLRKLFPGMKVIHMVRDGRDVAISSARAGWWHMNVAENAMRWAQETAVMRRFGRDHGANYIEVRYEDLMTHPQRELERMLSLFNLSFEPAMLDPSRLIDYFDLLKDPDPRRHSQAYHRWKRHPDKALFSESVYAWKRNADCDFSHLPPEVAERLAEFGYDP